MHKAGFFNPLLACVCNLDPLNIDVLDASRVANAWKTMTHASTQRCQPQCTSVLPLGWQSQDECAGGAAPFAGAAFLRPPRGAAALTQ